MAAILSFGRRQSAGRPAAALRWSQPGKVLSSKVLHGKARFRMAVLSTTLLSTALLGTGLVSSSAAAQAPATGQIAATSQLSAAPEQAGGWQSLLDPALSQWDSYLSFRHQESYNGEAPRDANGQLIAPVGLNTDPTGVFSTLTENGELLLRISGEIYGALTSKAQYRNYHLTLQYRFGDKKWPPRLQKLKDSGILYHATGPHGQEYFRSWMLSQEFQIMEGHSGDYWSQASSAIDIRAYPPESLMSAIADRRQPFISVGKGLTSPGFVMREVNAERPDGEWNQLELICFEGQSLHIVNGQVVMVLRNSRYVDAGGQTVPLVEGKIQLQSEAAEIFYKNIRIRAIGALPERYQPLF